MAGLNVSIAFLLLTVGICEVVRQLSKRLLSLGAYCCLARELVGSLQLCAGCLELRMLMEIGLWGGGFGADVTLTLLFLLFVAHGASFDGASANLTVSLQEFLILDSGLAATAAKLLAQFIGMGIGQVITKYYWSWELTDFHLIQNLMSLECSSSLHTSLSHGVFVEGVCSFLFHLVILKFHHSRPMYRVPALAVTVTFLAYIAGPFTGAFFNPVLATAVTFHCSGSSLQEYIQVYWLGPLAGMLAALFLYQGNIPRLFQKNLLYSQKSKYRIPKARVAHVSGDSGEQRWKKEGEKSNSELSD
ncbi:aquaporin-12-like [Apteryx mantelli]|uniref:Aquaporin n=2 Tax=Apteryx TaxID=8821 RepID=A0A8B9NV87_APTOW|nr:PREDICTED: aquaporin-12-like [Apteryx mantelli mantelli]XP_025934376.1 aquaporin-12-like [Apteryx rowi]